MVRNLILSWMILLSATVHGQQFGGFSPRAKWLQIDSDTARIIYQAPSEAQAQRIAAIVHRMVTADPNRLGNRLRKINIVLHAATTQANGYVALAPFRSEFYLIPQSNTFSLGNLPWPDQLAIHEYRHVQQYNNMNRGLSKIARAVLGEEGQALANAVAVPAWVFEGDAVHAETVFTPQGRGRLPYFMGGPSAVWLEGNEYSIAKWMNGSLKDYVPDHYQFGYLLINWGYKHWGKDFWPKVIADASAYKGLPTPLRSAIKRYTGQRYRTFVREAFANYKKELTDDTLTTSPTETVVRQQFPQMIGSDSLLYLESSYRSLPYFMLRNGDKTQKIAMRRISSEDWFSYRNGTIAYTAYATDARWSLTDYSNIILLDIVTGKEKALTRKSRYFTPDIAPSGNKLAAIHFDSATRSSLHILDVATGKVLQQVSIAEGTLLLHPRFIDENNLVMIHRRRNGSMALHRWDISTGKNELLLYAGFNTLGYPFVANNKVYFTSSASGSDDIYSLDLTSNDLEKIITTPTGAYGVSATADSIFFTQLTAYGLQLKSAAARGEAIPKSFLEREQVKFELSSDTADNLLQTEARRFATKRYPKATGLLRFHSWRPFYEDPDFTFTAYSNNILNTLEATAFYRYNQSERSHGVGTNIAYGGWFPVVSGGVEYTANRQLRTPAQTRTFNQWEGRVGTSVPLNFSGGKTYKVFRAGSDVVFNRLTETKARTPFTQNTTYLFHYLSFSQQLPRARQHIFPKWGYALAPQVRHQLDGPSYQWVFNAQAFLPSVRNHSLVLSGSVQTADTALSLFSNRFASSRGYADFYLPRMWRISANYHFPIAYPDWGFGGLVYFLRIRANLFYDHSQVWSPGKIDKRPLRSTGTEVFFDTKWLSQLETSIGIRYAYLLDRGLSGGPNQHQFSIVLPTNLIPD